MRPHGIRLLVDVCVGRNVERWLRENGYDILCVREINPRMKDREVLKIAVNEERMILTMDKDFGELVFNSEMPHSGVLLLRVADAPADEKINVLKKILEDFANELPGNFCVFRNGRLRIRRKL